MKTPRPSQQIPSREPPARAGARVPARSRALRVGRLLVALLGLGVAAPAFAGDSPPPRPPRGGGRGGGRGGDRGGPRGPGGYSIEQAISDRAQSTTIAFDGLAWLTGGLGQDTFFPPGKVCDYFGFQYMRDVDQGGLGHNSKFLPRIADNLLLALTAEQKAQLVALAREQAPQIEAFARKRFVVIKAFRRLLEGDLPKGSKGIDPEALAKVFEDLYQVDGEVAWRRAQATGAVLRALDEGQRKALTALKFDDSRTWPEVPEQVDRRSMTHREHVAVMTYASEMFSWWAGSLEADVYFCPERHGTYFGGFYMKDIPEMRSPGTGISTSLTGDSGEAFLRVLDDQQRPLVAGLVDAQRPALAKIVETRRAICSELRRFLKEDAQNRDKVVALARLYGRLDGELSLLYATAFAKVAKTLTEAQRAELVRLRNLPGDTCDGAFLYSDAIRMPEIPGTDALFAPGAAR